MNKSILNIGTYIHWCNVWVFHVGDSRLLEMMEDIYLKPYGGGWNEILALALDCDIKM